MAQLGVFQFIPFGGFPSQTRSQSDFFKHACFDDLSSWPQGSDPDYPIANGGRGPAALCQVSLEWFPVNRMQVRWDGLLVGDDYMTLPNPLTFSDEGAQDDF